MRFAKRRIDGAVLAGTLITNPIYRGRLVIRRGHADERPAPAGTWPALVAPELFDLLTEAPRRHAGQEE